MSAKIACASGRGKRKGPLTPSTTQDGISCLGADTFRVFDELPGELWESFAINHVTVFLGPEYVLLAISCIPHPISEEIRSINKSQCPWVPVVVRRIILSEVYRAVAVCHWNTGHVPEDEHEAKFLIVHVPEQRLASHIKLEKDAGRNEENTSW